MQVGVISAPAMRERWFASRGGGAWSDGPDGRRAIRVSRVAAIEDAQLVYGSHRDNVASGLMPGLRRPDRRLVARPRLRRLLGLRAGRRGRGRGHDGDRDASVGPRRAAGRHRGGRRPGHRRQRRAADRRRLVRGLERRCSTTRSCAGCGRPRRRGALPRPAERRERPAHGADGERREHARAAAWSFASPAPIAIGMPNTAIAPNRNRRRPRSPGSGASGSMPATPCASAQSVAVGSHGRARARVRRLIRIVAADRRQPQQRTARLGERPRVGGLEEVLRDGHRHRVVDRRPPATWSSTWPG